MALITILRPTTPAKPQGSTTPTDPDQLEFLSELLQELDPDVDYGTWMRIAMAVFHTTDGSAAGQALFDAWSSQGSKYRGSTEIARKWQSFDPSHERPVTVGTLIWMIQNGGGVLND